MVTGREHLLKQLAIYIAWVNPFCTCRTVARASVFLLLIWINFDPNMEYTHHKMWGEISYLFANFNGAATEVWQIISIFTPRFTERMISYLYW